jgi:ABC-2 type transport system ATP-binding protein
MALIEVNQLQKEYKINVRHKGILGAIRSLLIPEYRIKRAVDSISFQIEKGETVGFIGPNGAGKSTTVKMLTGILVPTSGEITVGGLSPYKDRKKNTSRIGVVFGQRSQLWWDLPVMDTYELLKHIYKIPDQQFKHNVDMFSELLELHEFLKQPVRQLSLGQKMRAEIAAALLHDPEIIFFDEPTIGLDIVAKAKIREFIRVVNQEKNTTMLFTTHDMDDIEKTCRRMIIIDKGTKIYDGSVDGIKQRYGRHRILSIEFGEDASPAMEHLGIPGVELVERKGSKWLFRFAKDQLPVSQLIQHFTQRYDIVDLTVQEPEIEGMIQEIYQGRLLLDESVCRVG